MFPEYLILSQQRSSFCFSAVLAPLGRFVDQVVSRRHRHILFMHTDAFRSIFLRPIEFPDLWAVIIRGQIDYEEILTNRDALVQYIIETTGKEDLVIGEVKELNIFRPVPYYLPFPRRPVPTDYLTTQPEYPNGRQVWRRLWICCWR